jgi:inosose dehydratase
MNRREVLTLLALPVALIGQDQRQKGVALGFSLYGMNGVPLADALRTCSEIGYDGVEFCLMPGWTPPDSLAPDERRSIKELLERYRLAPLALMVQLSLLEREMPEQVGVEKLMRAAQLGRSLGSDKPLIETVLGGKAKEWDQLKDQLADRLRVWGKTAQQSDFMLCIKAHAGAAVDSPQRLLWLYRQVNIPNLKLTYDYSHFQAAGLPLAATLKPIIREARFIHVKDAQGTEEHPRFLLAGDGGVDYVKYFRLLKKYGYSGPIVAEVSAQLQHLAGYNPSDAARHCYKTMAQAAKTAGLERVHLPA